MTQKDSAEVADCTFAPDLGLTRDVLESHNMGTGRWVRVFLSDVVSACASFPSAALQRPVEVQCTHAHAPTRIGMPPSPPPAPSNLHSTHTILCLHHRALTHAHSTHREHNIARLGVAVSH